MRSRSRLGHRLWGTVAIAACFVLGVAACSSSSPSSAGATSTSEATTTSTTVAAVPGTVEPRVLCVDVIGPGGDVVYFAYTNTGTAPVQVPVGASARAKPFHLLSDWRQREDGAKQR